MSVRWLVCATALCLLASGCRGSGSPATPAAGTATVIDATRDAFSLPAPSLTPEHRAAFFVGNSLFNRSWVAAPASLDSRDGLGPLFNARSCSGCHFKDGRSRPPEPGEPMRTMLLRVSVPGRGPHGAPLAEPTYGDQIQGSANPGVPAEGDVMIRYASVVPGAFADGQAYELLKPEYRVENLGYGALPASLLMSARVAPAMIGLGLLEAVPERALREREDPDDANHDGISGRANLVWDIERGAMVFGRFGWKAEQPTVKQQSASAFLGDLGVTSSLFPEEGCTAAEQRCTEQPNGGKPEVSDELLRDVVLYARTLGVPARRQNEAAARDGEALFERAGCAACHTPTLHTGDFAAIPELSKQEIHPYTDLLLHDLGDELADGRPSFSADGREWRTAPLWGIGLLRTVNEHTRLLHDGRARDVSEAILWHGGEARKARDNYTQMNRAERRALLAFLGSL